jgi:hypothetical protein
LVPTISSMLLPAALVEPEPELPLELPLLALAPLEVEVLGTLVLLELEQAVRLAPSTASAEMATARVVWVRDIADLLGN